MAGFVYMIDGGTSRSDIPALLNAQVTQRECFAGPGGLRGLLLGGPGCDAKDVHYQPQKQRWEKSILGDWHIGYWCKRPPKAVELARKICISGHAVEMADQPWVIPAARIFPTGTTLPQKVLLGEGGKLVYQIDPAFVAFSRKAEELWQDILILTGEVDGEAQMSSADMWKLAAEAVGINYHVTADEINLLGLFTTQTIEQILGALIDLPSIIQIEKELSEKKKEKR